MNRLWVVIVGALILIASSQLNAGPPWGPPGWPNGAPDPSAPPKPKCYKTERYCTERLKDGHCKLWDTRKIEVPC